MDNMNAGVIAAVAAAVMAFIWYILAVTVFYVVCEWRIYTKAGKPGWACIVPFYNYIVMLDIVGKPRWWLLLLFIPLVNFIIAIIVVNELSKRFGQGLGFTLGLLFLSFIFIPILAFGNYTYIPPPGADGGAAAATAA